MPGAKDPPLNDATATPASPTASRPLPTVRPQDWARLGSLRVPARVAVWLPRIAPVPFAVLDASGVERGRFGPDERDVCLAGADLPRDMQSGPCAACDRKLAKLAAEREEAAEHTCSVSPLRRLAIPIFVEGRSVGAIVTGSLLPRPLTRQEVSAAAGAVAKPGGAAAVAARLGEIPGVPPESVERASLLLRMAADEMGLFLSTGARRVVPETLRPMLGESISLEPVLRGIEIAARSERPVLITGETGTGKELVANAIHAQSARRARDLVIIDCGALPESLLESELFGHVRSAFTGAGQGRAGLFEEASGGTIFLDEVEYMSPALQMKLVRVTETQTFHRVGSPQPVRVDVRLIAATNEDLRALVERRAFRRDLYFRLNVLRIDLPPLRERSDDIPRLAEAFVRQTCLDEGVPEKRLDGSALAKLLGYRWPGNVRELLHAIERAVLGSAADRIRAEDIGVEPDRDGAKPPQGLLFRERRRLVVEAWERAELREGLIRSGGNKAQLARDIGLTRAKLSARLRKLGLLDSPARPKGRAGDGPP